MGCLAFRPITVESGCPVAFSQAVWYFLFTRTRICAETILPLRRARCQMSCRSNKPGPGVPAWLPAFGFLGPARRSRRPVASRATEDGFLPGPMEE